MKLFLLIFPFLLVNIESEPTIYQRDFDFYWNTVKNNFAYFDTQVINWDKVKSVYQPRVDTITSKRSFVKLLEEINHEFHNGHISLNVNLSTSNRLIPSGSDIWIEFKNNKFIITAIKNKSKAEIAGLKPNMEIINFNDIPISKAIKEFLPKTAKSINTKMIEYAANTLIAGTYDQQRKLTVLDGTRKRLFSPDEIILPIEEKQLLEVKNLKNNIGYIKINNSLWNNNLIPAFDKALDYLINTEALIIDLRDTPSGGNTTVARSIMGRFIKKEMHYQKHRLINEEIEFGVKRSWIEIVSPRGNIYAKPLVIISGRWTGSMGEGLTIGFDAMNRAEIVGTEMAKLIGAIYSFNLPETNFGFSFPCEKLYHINGTPRENFVPKYLIHGHKNQLKKAIEILKKKIK